MYILIPCWDLLSVDHLMARNIHYLCEYIEVVEKPVHQVEGPGRHIRDQSEFISVFDLLKDYFDPFYLEKRLEDPEQRSGIVQLL